MGDVLLNGRPAADFELAAIERTRQRGHDQALELLAGVLTREPVPRHEGRRPVTDLILELGR